MQWSISQGWINPVLGEWLTGLVAETSKPTARPSITFGPPSSDGGRGAEAERSAEGFNMHLLSITPHAQATTRDERRTETQLVLRYLITSWAQSRDAADALLCTLAIALLVHGATGPDGRSDIIVETAPPPVELWAALGVPPRPALLLALPLMYAEALESARRVTQPPIIRGGPAERLFGVLVGPNEVPIAGAQVDLPAYGRVTETDRQGHFEFVGVPSKLVGQLVRVRARGVERSFQVKAERMHAPLVLRMSFGEEG
jgi:hypothetical protein